MYEVRVSRLYITSAIALNIPQSGSNEGLGNFAATVTWQHSGDPDRLFVINNPFRDEVFMTHIKAQYLRNSWFHNTGAGQTFILIFEFVFSQRPQEAIEASLGYVRFTTIIDVFHWSLLNWS